MIGDAATPFLAPREQVSGIVSCGVIIQPSVMQFLLIHRLVKLRIVSPVSRGGGALRLATDGALAAPGAKASYFLPQFAPFTIFPLQTSRAPHRLARWNCPPNISIAPPSLLIIWILRRAFFIKTQRRAYAHTRLPFVFGQRRLATLTERFDIGLRIRESCR